MGTMGNSKRNQLEIAYKNYQHFSDPLECKQKIIKAY